MKQLIDALRDSFNQFWESRQERERLYLSVGAVALLLALIYLIAVDPALTGRDELKKSLPLLHQQAAQMQQMAQALTAIPSPENRHEVNREMVEAALNTNGLKAQMLSVNDGIIRAQFSNANMSGLQGWLLEMQRSGGMFVDEIKIVGQDGGVVSANLTLRQAGGAS
jgi:general secretion pathway protein M